VRALRALHAATGGGKPLPDLTWEYQWDDTALTLCVRSRPGARGLRVWQAESADRDFRDATWAVATEARKSSARFELAQPASGYVAVFVEAAFGHGLRAFALSTNLAVFPAASEPAYGTRPMGQAGECAAVKVAPQPIG
jgi:PhoPQ-activated pathogenicity-related protein